MLVGAAAGGGKTYVLVERFVYLTLRGKADPENLPTLTFTEKAAEQLKRRIRNRLEKSKASREILRGLDGAYISTIHSFCRRLLRENYHLAGIDPSFLVLPEEESRLMKGRALDEIFEDIFIGQADGADFLENTRELCEAHGGPDFDKGIKRQVLDLYGWLMKQVNPVEMLDHLEVESASDPLKVPGFEIYIKMLSDQVTQLADGYRSLEPWVSDVKKDGDPSAYAKNIKQAILDLEEIISIKPGSDPAKFLQLAAAWKPPAMRGGAPVELKELSDSLKATIYKRFEKFRPPPFDEGFEEMEISHRHLKVLAKITRLFIERYERLKTRRWGLDFDDLQHRLMRLLRENPQIGEAYRQRFKYLLIDEFQDNNRLQEAIIREVCAPGGLFMVGDGKQAIYRFRGAEPNVFLENEEKLSGSGDGGLIRLENNFRSLPSICNSINDLMAPLFSGDAAEIDYTDGHALKASRESGADGELPTEFHIIGRPESTSNHAHSDDEDVDDRQTLEIEADWVAGRIHRLIESKELSIPAEDGSQHPASFGDVVILLRSMANRASAYSNALKRFGIPHRQAGAGGFLEGREIRDIRNLLRIIDNPLQDIPFAAVLRSPLCGIDVDGLYELQRFAPDADNLYSAVVLAIDDVFEDAITLERISEFHKRLKHWRGIEGRLTPAELILDIYRVSYYPDYVLGLNGGRVARANLDRFIDIARSAVPVGEGGLRRFLNYLDEIESGDFSISPGDVPEIEGAVTIMSIHSAKGLEFPVVFIPDLGKRFNAEDLRGDIIFDDEHGPAYRFIDNRRGYGRPTYDYIAFRERLRNRGWAEELRIYYVAFTRAREMLIASGTYDLQRLNRSANISISGMDPYALSPMQWFVPVLSDMTGFDELFNDAEWASKGTAAKIAGEYGGTWHIAITSASDVGKSKKTETEDKGLRKSIAAFRPLGINVETPSEIEPVLAEYPYDWATELHDKITAGRIGDDDWISSEDEVMDYNPIQWDSEYRDVSEDAKLTGIILHNAFERLEFNGITEPDWAAKEAERISGITELPEGWDAGRLAETLAGLASSPLVDMIAGADDIWRETAFSLKLPLDDLKPDADPPAQAKDWIMLQGRMDLVVMKGETAWLIDYKSDSLTREKIKDKSEKYIPQMAAYAKALGGIKGFDVRCILYFIRLGEHYDLTEEVSNFDWREKVLSSCHKSKTDAESKGPPKLV